VKQEKKGHEKLHHAGQVEDCKMGRRIIKMVSASLEEKKALNCSLWILHSMYTGLSFVTSLEAYEAGLII
jgi:hypothetical protein